MKCNNSSTLGSNKLSWRHLKIIVKDSMCLRNIINIADVCFELEYWLSHFKTSTSIIIPKPNKELDNSPKAFRPIVLLNIIGKLIEKVIGEQLQFHAISNNFIHLSQLNGLKQYSSSNASIAPTHFICTGWIKNNYTSTLIFDIAQFFSSLNHYLLPLIFKKVEFDLKVSSFFWNYLVGRKTKYFWNNSFSSFFKVDIGVGQELALFPILFALYLAPILHILENWLKILKIPISNLLFVNNSLLVAQNKSLSIPNYFLFYGYQITSSLLDRLGLTCCNNH